MSNSNAEALRMIAHTLRGKAATLEGIADQMEPETGMAAEQQGGRATARQGKYGYTGMLVDAMDEDMARHLQPVIYDLQDDFGRGAIKFANAINHAAVRRGKAHIHAFVDDGEVCVENTRIKHLIQTGDLIQTEDGEGYAYSEAARAKLRAMYEADRMS